MLESSEEAGLHLPNSTLFLELYNIGICPSPPSLYEYFVPIQYNKLPTPTLTTKCCPKLQAILYKYFGEKTVQINKCVLSNVQAAITKNRLLVTNTVRSARCCPSKPFCPGFFLRSCKSRRLVAEVKKIGPAQLLTKVRRPTARTL